MKKPKPNEKPETRQRNWHAQGLSVKRQNKKQLVSKRNAKLQKKSREKKKKKKLQNARLQNRQKKKLLN